MKPILYEVSETAFATNGLGMLSDAITCTVTEERNGAYTLEMTYPIDGVHFADMAMDRIILAPPNDQDQWQPFRIYAIRPSMAGTAQIYAEHISYQLSSIPCSPFSADSPAEAMAGLRANAAVDVPFSFWTDVASSDTYRQNTPDSIKSRLCGVEGSVLDLYGGELEWDRFAVKLHTQRGADNNVVVSYGKNLLSLEQEQSISEALTGVYPYYCKDGVYLELPEKIVQTSVSSLAYPRIRVLDCTDAFPDSGVEDLVALEVVANDYIRKNGLDRPKVSLTVEFAPLWQTEEYKAIAALERVRLCDTVTVRFPRLGVDAKTKVIKTVYDVLQDRYISVGLGDVRQTMDKTIAALMRR